MTVKLPAYAIEKEKLEKKLIEEEKAIEVITNALQADETKYTTKIDNALYVLQRLVAEKRKEFDNHNLLY